jgi:magnesium chelatase accessory protein
MATSKPDWAIEGRDWPNRPASRFVRAGGLDWHVQTMGKGPVLLLLHGTGAATHSWRGLAPLLAKRCTIIAPDLPGHGFTDLPDRGALSLTGMAAAVPALLDKLGAVPDAVAGHSAGAALAIRMTLDGRIAPRRIVSLNGALMPFPGLAAIAFPALARLLFGNSLAAPFLAGRAQKPGAVRRLIEGTGSHLDAAQLSFYERLFRTERHMAATVGMMANWDLRTLKRDLPRLRVPLTLVSALRDKAVPPPVARDVAGIVSAARTVDLPALGHLAHEEAPEMLAKVMLRAIGVPELVRPCSVHPS